MYFEFLYLIIVLNHTVYNSNNSFYIEIYMYKNKLKRICFIESHMRFFLENILLLRYFINLSLVVIWSLN